MVYDPALAARIRGLLADQEEGQGDIVEKEMFGGVGFLHRGNMCCGVWKDWLIARIGPDRYAAALAREHVVKFDVTGRAMKGWVMVDPAGVGEDEQLWDWLSTALRFVHTLPRKK